MEKRLTMFFACLFLSLGMALAQTKVTGTVISQDDNGVLLMLAWSLLKLVPVPICVLC